MKLADANFVIWLIIFAFVALAKGWSKLQQQIDDDSAGEPPTRPVEKRAPPRPRPRPVSQGLPPRAVEKRVPVPRPTESASWKGGGPTQLREFIEQLQRNLQPQPTQAPPVSRAAPPPVREAPPPPAHPPAPPPAPQAEPVPTAAAPTAPSRASQWAEALRDRQNIRNIIISAEIMGPPKGA